MPTISLIPQLAINAEANLNQLRRILAEREDEGARTVSKDQLVLMWHNVVEAYSFTGYIKADSVPCRYENKRFWAHVSAAVSGRTLLGELVSASIDQYDFDQSSTMIEGGQDGPYLAAIDQVLSLPVAINYSPHIDFAQRLRKVVRKAPEDVKVLDLISPDDIYIQSSILSVVRESVAYDLLLRVKDTDKKKPERTLRPNGRNNPAFWLPLEEAAWQAASDAKLDQATRREARTLYNRLISDAHLENSVWRRSVKECDFLEYVEGERSVRVDLMTRALAERGVSESTAHSIGEYAAV